MFAIWRACERFGILPPGVKSRSWDDLNAIAQSELIAFNQIRELEDHDWDIQRLKYEVGAR